MARTKKKRPEKSLAHDRIVELQTAITEVRNGQKPAHIPPSCSQRDSREWHKSWLKKRLKSSSKRFVGSGRAVINETVDLIYNLVVLWSELGITASEVWAEMDRRQALLGMAEKLPKEAGVGSTSSVGP